MLYTIDINVFEHSLTTTHCNFTQDLKVLQIQNIDPKTRVIYLNKVTRDKLSCR